MRLADRIERFFSSRGFYTKNLNPPGRFVRANRALFQFQLGLRVAFGWGHEGGVVAGSHGVMVRIPLFGYQLNVRLSLGRGDSTEDLIHAA